MIYGGKRVVVSELCYRYEQQNRARTWKQRLLSWPWTPWQRDETQTVKVPTGQVFMTADTIFCDHKVMDTLKEKVKNG